jgi:hypothetical protein
MNENEDQEIKELIQSCDFSSKAHKRQLWLKLKSSADLSDEMLADVAAAGTPTAPETEAAKKLKDLGKKE